jgi:YD repeat-containing protein
LGRTLSIVINRARVCKNDINDMLFWTKAWRVPLWVGLAALFTLLTPPPLSAQGVFVRGDCTQDLTLDIADPIKLLNYLFLGGPTPACLDACDFDDSEENDISDAIAVLNYLFLGGPPPPPPFPEEGVDPAGTRLTCQNGKLPVLELRVTPDELVFYRVGDGELLTVLGVLPGDGTGGPGRADLRVDPRTVYRSDHPEIAKVSASGLVTAVAPGRASLTVEYRRLSAAVSVRVADSAGGAPVLRIAAPQDGAVVTSPSVLLSGTVSGAGAQVTVNGAPAAVDAATLGFQAKIDLALGSNRIVIAATRASLKSQVEIVVTRAAPGSEAAVGPDGERLPDLPPPYTTPSDRTAPGIAITSPRSGALLASALTQVSGTIDDPSAVVRVNGIPAAVADGGFSARIVLSRGPARIEAEAIDAVGNRGSDLVEVSVDPEVPAAAITDPPLANLGTHQSIPEGVALALSSPITVRGVLSRPGMQVWVNGTPAAVSGTTFSGTVALERGLNRVAVLAEVPGDAPRRVVAVRRVLLDLDPPSIEITYPPDGYRTGASQVLLAGRIRSAGSPPGAAGAVTLRVNGTDVPVAGGGFQAAVTLSAGTNPLSLRAVDLAGLAGSRDLGVQQVTGSSPSLEIGDGADQSVGPGQTLPRSLVARARDGAGGLTAGVPVVFRVAAGDGLLLGGVRERMVMTDASGEARIGFTAGLAAGKGFHLVTARSPGRLGSPLGFAVTVNPGPAGALAAHSPRWEIGAAGQSLVRPFTVRALDGFGNPIEGLPVQFLVTSGSARLAGGQSLNAVTGPEGLAAGLLTLAGESAGDERNVVTASAGSLGLVTFTADSLVAGPPGDTSLTGTVSDLTGAPLLGIAVRFADLSGPGTTTGSGGRFELAGAPAGPAQLLFDGGSGYASTSREALLVSGRRNPLREPVRLVPLLSGPRRVEIPVSEISGGTAALPAIPGMRLEVAAGSARFADGTRRGRVSLAAAGLEALGSAVPDSSRIEFPVLVLPESVRFDPPARLYVPSSREGAGRELALLSAPPSAGSFLEAGRGKVREDGAFVESLPGLGVSAGGVSVFSVAGPPGGRAVPVEGTVALAGPGTTSVDQRAESPVVGASVYAHSGEFFLEAVDLTIKGRGIDYRFRRRYESRHSFQGSLGYNWEHEYADRRLIPLPGSDNLLRADGNGRFDEYLLSSTTGAYISPIGVFSRLSRDPQGYLVEREPDGTRYRYRPLDGSGLSGRLAEIADRFGNRISIARDDRGRVTTVLDSMSRAINYQYDEADRISSVTDFTGRQVDFSYDSRGDLVAVTGPSIQGTPNGNDFPGGRSCRYEYAGSGRDARLDHNLLRVFAPQDQESGSPRLVNQYDEDPASPSFDRVIGQDWGGQNDSGVIAGGSLTIGYDIRPSGTGDGGGVEAAALLSEGGTTVVTDRRGLRTEIDWNRLGLATAVRRYTRGDLRPRDPGSLHPGPGIDPPFFETRHRWSPEGLLLETVFPRGNRVTYDHDEGAPLRWSRANVVRETRYPAPGAPGGESPAVTTYLWDPLFAQCIRLVPPRGNDLSYLPPQGGAGGPDRYATVHLLDYQEQGDLARLSADAGVDPLDLKEGFDRAGMALNLGDLNGDGDTSAALGLEVRTIHPAVVLPDGSTQEAVETAVYNHLGQKVAATGPEGATTRFRYYPETDPDGDGQPNQGSGLNPNTGGYLAEETVDADTGGPFPPARVRASYQYDPLGRLARRTDGNGNTSELTYNAVGELVQYRAPAPLNYRRTFRHDANGNLVELEIENFTANLDGFPLPVAQHRFITSSWVYDILDRVVQETREISAGEAGPARSAVTTYSYDASGNLVRVVHPEGDEELFSYDERELLLEATRGGGSGLDPGGESVERFDYDENGNLVRVTSPEDVDQDGERETTAYRFDGFDRLVSRSDAAGGLWFASRDPEGRVVSEGFLGSPGGPTPRSGEGNVLLLSRKRLHDERGREYLTVVSRFGPGLPAHADPAIETRFHDREGRLVRRVDPAGQVWTESRDGAGRAALSTDPLGNTVSRTYDAAGNLTGETRADLSADPLSPAAGAAGDPDYDASGRLRQLKRTVYGYDSLNRLSVAVDGAGRTRRWRYDSRDQVVHQTDAVGTVINAGTDQELALLLPLLTQYQADHSNTHGNQTHYEYDGLGRLVRAVHEMRQDGQGQRDLDHGNPFNDDGLIDERFEWDGDGRMVAWIDDRGNRTGVSYDRLGRARTRADPDGKVESYQYDLAGNLVKVIDRMGTVIEQRFDALSRLVERDISPGTGSDGIAPEGTTLQRFEYDGLGRVTLAFDGNRPDDPADDLLVLRGYDSQGGLRFECQGPYVISIERDLAGRATAVVYPDGRRLLFARDALGRVRELKDSSRLYGQFSYLGPDQVLGRVLGNGLRQDYLAVDTSGVPRAGGFSDAGQVALEEYRQAGGQRVLGYEYGYDRAGRRLYERRLHHGGRGPSLRYDSIGRTREYQPDLLDPRVPLPSPTVFTRLFPDGSHNPRLAVVNFVEKRTEVDLLDRLTTVDQKPLSYDQGGNLSAAGDLELRYDALGRLSRIRKGGVDLARYGHDAVGAWDPLEFRLQGRPVRREPLAASPEPPGAVRTLFLHDQPIEERAESGGPLKQYLGGPDGRALAAIDFTRGGQPLFYLSDGAGSVAGVTDATGGLLEETTYDLFGAPSFLLADGTVRAGSNIGNRLLHGARLWDAAVGLYETGARRYSPALARWVARGGPLLIREPLAMNRYAILDPVNGFQPRAGRIEDPLPPLPAPPELPASVRGAREPRLEEFLPAGLRG